MKPACLLASAAGLDHGRVAAAQQRSEDAERQRAKQAMQAGDSLAAMEAFAAAAKRHEEVKEEQEARVEHLNETSFDRRRKVAVYKSDGRRGHHMQVRASFAIAACVWVGHKA